MYNKGEYVIYGLNGVCYIEGVTTLDIRDVPKDTEYYSLVPLNQGGKIYVKVESAHDKMRTIISKDDAEQLIEHIREVEPIKITNEKTVEEAYRRCMKTIDCIEWVRLIKCIYHRRTEREESGKKATAIDEKYMRMAEEALYSELAVALDIPKKEVVNYIGSKLSE